jgi:hypothetical protein
MEPTSKQQRRQGPHERVIVQIDLDCFYAQVWYL